MLRQTVMALVVFLILFIPRGTVGIFPSEDLTTDDLHKQGDLNIGALFSLYKTEPGKLCGSQPWDTSIRAAQAMVFMIDVINQDPALLDNLTLGYAILNDCNRQNVALAKVTKFIPLDDCVRKGCSGLTLENREIGEMINSSLKDTNGNDNSRSVIGQDPPRKYYDVVGVLASYSSKFAVLCSSLLGVYKIPEISWSATSNELSDKTRYAYFSRVVPGDLYQAKAIVSILKRFNWTYISTIHSEGSYGADGAKYVMRFAREAGICVAYSKELAPDETPEGYDRVVRNLQKHHKAKAVIMFILAADLNGVLWALERAHAVGQFYLIGSDAFIFDDLRNVRELAINSLYIDLVTSSSTEFEKYYMNLNPWNQVANGNPWEGQYVPEYIGCSWTIPKGQERSCHDYNNITDFPDFPFSQSPTGVMDAIKAFAIALDELIKENCPDAKIYKERLKACVNGPRLLGYIRRVTFNGYSGDIELDENGDLIGGYNIRHVRPDDNGDIILAKVGYWSRQNSELTMEESVLRWFKSDNSTPVLDLEVPESVCAKPCFPGEFYVRGELVCCWECRKCRDNERVREDGYGCEVCPENTWPDQEEFTTCQPIPPTYMNWLDPIGLGLVAMAAVGLLTVFILIHIFSKHKDKKVIRGSSIELMVFIKIGLFLAYGTVFAFITKAETWACYTNYFGFNLSCTLIFGPLFVKTNRVYRIFAASENLKKRIKMVDATSQVIFIVLIVLIQVGNDVQ